MPDDLWQVQAAFGNSQQIFSNPAPYAEAKREFDDIVARTLKDPDLVLVRQTDDYAEFGKPEMFVAITLVKMDDHA